MVSMADLARSPIVRSRWTPLAEAAVASHPAIRARPVGGNLAYAEAASDVAPALLCLGASIETGRPGGDRSVPITSFFTGSTRRRSSRRDREGSPRSGVPRLAPATSFCPRSAEDKPLIGVAALVDRRGRCRDVRIALGGAAPTDQSESGGCRYEETLMTARSAAADAGPPRRIHSPI
jgi:CO/xanthine dehydrogenase FAD-binding subunit